MSAETVSVFVSYSHKDDRLKRQLESHLSLLQRQAVIKGWSDREISAGEALDDQIDINMEKAQIILLLVSSDFINSNYCYGKELTRAIAKHETGGARVIPIVIRPVDWHDAPFAALKMLPHDAKAVTTWRNRDEAWKNVSEGIRQSIRNLRGHTNGVQEQQYEDDLGWLDFAAQLETSTEEFLSRLNKLGKIPSEIEQELKYPAMRLQASKTGTATQQLQAASAVAKIMITFAERTSHTLPGLESALQNFEQSIFSLLGVMRKQEVQYSVSDHGDSKTDIVQKMESVSLGLQKPIGDIQLLRAELAKMNGISQDLNAAIRQNDAAFAGIIALFQRVGIVCNSIASDLKEG